MTAGVIACAKFGATVWADVDPALLSKRLRWIIAHESMRDPEDSAEDQAICDRIQTTMAEAFNGYSLLLTPTSLVIAGQLGSSEPRMANFAVLASIAL